MREADGVTCIDDSKGTNVGAVVEAIEAVAAPIILLAGGLDKGGDYAPLRPDPDQGETGDFVRRRERENARRVGRLYADGWWRP